MPKTLIPHYHVPSTAYASLDPANPGIVDLSFVEGDQLYAFRLKRDQLERLHRDIGAKLKAAPPPARGR